MPSARWERFHSNTIEFSIVVWTSFLPHQCGPSDLYLIPVWEILLYANWLLGFLHFNIWALLNHQWSTWATSREALPKCKFFLSPKVYSFKVATKDDICIFATSDSLTQVCHPILRLMRPQIKKTHPMIYLTLITWPCHRQFYRNECQSDAIHTNSNSCTGRMRTGRQNAVVSIVDVQIAIETQKHRK